MTNERIADLFKRLRENKCTDDEIAELNNWYHSLKGGRPDFEAWIKESGGEEKLSNLLLDRFKQKMAFRQRRHTRQIWYRVAVVLLIAFTGGAIFIQRQKHTVENRESVVKKTVMPGSNRAVLTLADGSKVDLDSSAKGYLANQAGGISIKKTGTGKLQYERTGVVNANKLMYNTIATPRAGQYEIELPDGTKVWLNAETKLRYPVQFNAGERRVELTGEAYFEVAHNEALPFKVVTAEQTVTVLGTHFNIKGYADENTIATTLLEGSVSIVNKLSKQSKILAPGKQANIVRGKGLIDINNARVDEIMAWKNGYFIFENQDIKSIMKLISRWYDVDVDFKLTRSVSFGGTFSRSSDLNKLLKNFELLGDVHFELKERRITVSN
jgi:transmembrane sensor